MKNDLKTLLRSRVYLMANSFKKGFFRTLEILKDYLPDIVIAGGWAPLIYYHYLLSNKELEPLRTKDIDIVVPNKLEKKAARTIDESLIEAGFKPRFKSRHTPPAVSYVGNIEGWYVGRLKEVPGVFSQGPTLDELKQNILDAYNLMIEEKT
jgi:hypothetical protein